MKLARSLDVTQNYGTNLYFMLYKQANQRRTACEYVGKCQRKPPKRLNHPKKGSQKTPKLSSKETSSHSELVTYGHLDSGCHRLKRRKKAPFSVFVEQQLHGV